jgi:L-aspartate oxidase
MVRNGEELEEAATIIASWQKGLKQPTDRSSYELSNMLLVGRLMAEAALIREESRGVHFRSDFPQPSSEWQRHIIFRKG